VILPGAPHALTPCLAAKTLLGLQLRHEQGNEAMARDWTQLLSWDETELQRFQLHVVEAEVRREYVSGWGPDKVFQVIATFAHDGPGDRIRPFDVNIKLLDAHGAQIEERTERATRGGRLFPLTASIRMPLNVESKRDTERVAHIVARPMFGGPDPDDPVEVPVSLPKEYFKDAGLEVVFARAHWVASIWGGSEIAVQLNLRAARDIPSRVDLTVNDEFGVPCTSGLTSMYAQPVATRPGEFTATHRWDCHKEPREVLVHVELERVEADQYVEPLNEPVLASEPWEDLAPPAPAEHSQRRTTPFGRSSAELAVTLLHLQSSDTKHIRVAHLADALEKLLDDADLPDLDGIAAFTHIVKYLTGCLERGTLQPQSSRWTWPRPGWEEWVDETTRELDSIPGQMWHDMVFDLPFEGAWLQIAGTDGNYSIQIYDPNVRFQDLAQLEWTPHEMDGSPGVFWEHNYSMTHAIGAVDRAAQGMALGLEIPDPADLA
jgi:hypothetical protein